MLPTYRNETHLSLILLVLVPFSPPLPPACCSHTPQSSTSLILRLHRLTPTPAPTSRSTSSPPSPLSPNRPFSINLFHFIIILIFIRSLGDTLATHVVFVLSRKRITCFKMILYGLDLRLANKYHIPRRLFLLLSRDFSLTQVVV